MDLLLELGDVVERSVRSATSKSGIFVVDQEQRLQRRGAETQCRELLAAFFVNEAEAEEQAVERWEALGEELQALAAPREFIEYCSSASLSALRHAKELELAARRHGAEPVSSCLSLGQVRELHQLARDNAVQGCVFLTFRAVRLRHQAEAARNPEVLRIVSELAADQSRHAGFYWEMHRWALGQISPQRGRDIRALQLVAIRQLRDMAAHESLGPHQQELGLPDAEAGLALLDALNRELWKMPASES